MDERVTIVSERPVAAVVRHRSVPWAAALAVLLLSAFAVFTFVDEPAGNHRVDRLAADVARVVVRGSLHRPIDTLAQLGTPAISVILALVIAAAFALRGWWIAAALVLVLLGAFTGVESILRIRLSAVPWGDIPGLIAQPRGRHLMESSYPSGHVGRVVLLGGCAVAALPRWLRLPGCAIVLLVGVAIGIQRVHASAHTGSDGLGGLLLAGGMAAIFALLLPLVATAQAAVVRRLEGQT